MEIAIFGLPLCGKTTLFTLLTGVTTGPSRRGEPSVGVAPVHDPRVEHLSAIFNPRKTTYASLTFVDLPSYDLAANRKEKTRVLQYIQDADAVLAVVRAFSSASVAWPPGAERPLRQLEAIKAELLLRDMEVVEGRLTRLDEGQRRHRLTADEERERLLLLRVQDGLDSEVPVSRLALTDEEQRLLGSLALFTAKPLIVAANLDEGQFDCGVYPDAEAVREYCQANGYALIDLCGKVEAEIAALDEADRASFMQALGITESGIQRLSRLVYSHLGLVSFLTVGEDEVRAWTLRSDSTARAAAGKIHTDLERHFVRAEVVPYTLFAEAGDMATARSRGLVKKCGRDEIIHDGDIVNILANA